VFPKSHLLMSIPLLGRKVPSSTFGFLGVVMKALLRRWIPPQQTQTPSPQVLWVPQTTGHPGLLKQGISEATPHGIGTPRLIMKLRHVAFGGQGSKGMLMLPHWFDDHEDDVDALALIKLT
jgi:hypothetical protein